MEFLAYEDGVIRDPRYRDEVAPTANRITRKLKLASEPVVPRNNKVSLPTQRRQLPESKRPFSCSPKEVIFRDFDLEYTYTINVKLTNVTNGFNSFRVSPVSPEFSDIISIDYVLPPRIAAGLSWTIRIKFRPVKNEDITTKFQITTESGYFFLPVRTLKKRAVVTVDVSEVDFGTLTLGDSKKKNIMLYNNGASLGSVYISGSFKKIAEKMHIDPVSKQEFPYLVMNPLMFRIDIPAFSKFQLELIFAPYEEVDFNCTIIFSDRHEASDSDYVVTVRGQATSLPVHVSSPALNFSWCFYGCTYSREVSIMNSANITAIVEPEVPKDLEQVIRFDPKMICIQAGTELNIMAYFTPQPFLGTDFTAVIDFNVKGQTLPATVKIAASLTTREPSVQTMSIDVGTCFNNSESISGLPVTNQSDLPQMLGFPRLPENISVYPQTLTILPKETYEFQICVVPPCVGRYSQQLVLLNEYGDKKSIEITGIGSLPALKFSECTIFLPPCSLDSSVSASTVVRNTTKEYRQFFFQVPGDYIRVSPSTGALRPGESIPVVIFFVAPPEFIAVAAEPPPPTTLKQAKRKRVTKAHGHPREAPLVAEVEQPKVSSYVDWEDPGELSPGSPSMWSKHKCVLLRCTSSAASEKSEETCFIKIHCTAIKASVVGRSLLSIKSAVPDAAPEKKATKGSKKADPAPTMPTAIDRIDVSPFNCTLFVDFGEVTLNRVTQRVCFLKSNEEGATTFQLRPVDLVSPFTVVRYPDHLFLPGEEDIVIIQFQPSEYGVYSDVITFSSSTGNDVDIFLSGACCCTDLVVSLDANMDVSNPRESVDTVPIPTTLLTETTQVPLYFYNLGAFALDVSLQFDETVDWTLRRTFVLHPDKFIVPPKGKMVSSCYFTPQKDGPYEQRIAVKAGGFEHALRFEGRGCGQRIYVIPPKENSASQAQITSVDAADPHHGKSAVYPYHLHFARGEGKHFTFGSIRGGPAAECLVEGWTDVFTKAGWSVDTMRLVVPSGGTQTLGIHLSYNDMANDGVIPYCRFSIHLRCPADPSVDTTLYLCCTGEMYDDQLESIEHCRCRVEASSSKPVRSDLVNNNNNKNNKSNQQRRKISGVVPCCLIYFMMGSSGLWCSPCQPRYASSPSPPPPLPLCFSFYLLRFTLPIPTQAELHSEIPARFILLWPIHPFIHCLHTLHKVVGQNNPNESEHTSSQLPLHSPAFVRHTHTHTLLCAPLMADYRAWQQPPPQLYPPPPPGTGAGLESAVPPPGSAYPPHGMAGGHPAGTDLREKTDYYAAQQPLYAPQKPPQGPPAPVVGAPTEEYAPYAPQPQPGAYPPTYPPSYVSQPYVPQQPYYADPFTAPLPPSEPPQLQPPAAVSGYPPHLAQAMHPYGVATATPPPAPPLVGSGAYSYETLSAALSANTHIAAQAQQEKTQEEQDRLQLEKIVRLRRQLELEEEREREKEREKETWGCPTCTFRNPLPVTHCEMCSAPNPKAAAPPAPSSSQAYTAPPAPAAAVVWECGTCLSQQRHTGPQCNVCGAIRTGTAAGSTSQPRAPAPPGAPSMPMHCQWRCSVCNKVNQPSRAHCEACNGYRRNGIPVLDGPPVSLRPAPTAPAPSAEASAATVWTCSVCTLENSVSNAVCSACESGQRPRHLAPPRSHRSKKLDSRSGDGVKAPHHTPGEDGQASESWSCPTCTFVNSTAHVKCDMCGTKWPDRPKGEHGSRTAAAAAKRDQQSDDEESIMWQEDHIAKTCNRCHNEFSMLRRRHHCRACGFVFCATCSPFHAPLKKDGPPVRMCNACYEARHGK
eukprot:gene12558-8607_t